MLDSLKKTFFLLIISFALILCSCSSGGEDQVPRAEVNATLLRIGDNKIALKKALILVLGQKDMIESTYGSDIWNVSLSEKNLDELVKEKIKIRIGMIYTGSLLAGSRGIRLDHDEEILSASAADYLFAKLSAADREELKLSADELYDIYYSYRLAVCGYKTLLDEAEIEVSRDEARIIRLARIKVSTMGLSGADLSLKKARLSEAAQKIADGADFGAVASEYDENGKTEMYAARGELPSKEEEIAFSLNEGEVSSVFESDDSLVIIKCLDSYDEVRSDAARERITSEKQSAYYIEALEDFLKKNPLIWNDAVWNSLDLSAISYKTDSNFFEVYDMFFPETADGGDQR